MKFKKILLITLLLLAVFTISSVSATDNLTDEGVLQENHMGELELSEDGNDEILSSSQKDLIGEPDDGTFTALQNKINNAQSGATITLENDYAFDDGFDVNGISFSWKKNLTIDGKGHTLNGLSKSRILNIAEGVNSNISIKNIIFKNGYSNNGGGIYISNVNSDYKMNITITNCEFDNNAGGAICGDHSSYVIIQSCTFKNNVASYTGGAICNSNYNANNWFILNCNFVNNHAGSGGAIYSKIKNLHIENSNFNNNYADNDGGAIDIYYTTANGVKTGGSNSNVINCEFNDNKARHGGAIYWCGDNGCLNSSIFKYNMASQADAVYWVSENSFINNCKSYTTGNKENNLFVADIVKSTTTINGFDVTVVKSTSDSQSSSGSSSSTSKTTKATPKLTVKKATFKVKAKTKKYTATLKTDKNRAMKKITLYLKVKGKTYTAKTNSKGKAIFKIKNLKKKGAYKATVTFKGNNNFNKVTKTVKIIVK